jgi:hypothetical protein
MSHVGISGAIATELRRVLIAFGIEIERLRMDAGVTPRDPAADSRRCGRMCRHG